jgi:hypothetical protein
MKQQSSSSTIQWAGWNAMPEHTDTPKEYDCPTPINQKTEEKKMTPQRLPPIMNI